MKRVLERRTGKRSKWGARFRDRAPRFSQAYCSGGKRKMMAWNGWPEEPQRHGRVRLGRALAMLAVAGTIFAGACWLMWRADLAHACAGACR